MSRGKRISLLIVVAVVVIAGMVLYASLANRQASPIAANSSSATSGSPVFAPKGQITLGFPKELILDSNPSVDGSYSVSYASGTNQYTAEWNSSSSMVALYDAYKTYLPTHGWAVINDIVKYAASRGIYATNASSDVVSVAITVAGNGSHASVTYIAK